MRNRLTLALLLGTLAFGGVACTRMRSAPAHLPIHRMEHADLERNYRLIVPASYDTATPMALVLALVERLSEDYNVDPARIYVTGASNGGMMTQRLACEASTVFAAAAVVIASQPVNLDCLPDRPISILFMNGTDDPLMPYEGGQVRFYRQQLGEVLSTQETVTFWAGVNGCDPAPVTEMLPDLDPEDGTRIRLDAYFGCDQGSRVLLYTMQGGGHTWPGGSQYLPRSVIGRVSRDLKANAVIWTFFVVSRRERLQ